MKGKRMGVVNPVETILGVMALIDEVREKMEGTPLAELPWRPSTPDATDELTALTQQAMARCRDVTEAVIVVTVAMVSVAAREAQRRN